jgi:ABC-type phosphate transport system substrate-binding protein
MSSTWNRMKRMLGAAVPTSIAVLAMSSGIAQAQLTIEGSDTLTEVITNAITQSGASLVYSNIGSGQAEKNMLGTGNFLQGIGPMSRNFVQSVLTAHPTWAPTDANVLALDAGIVGVANIAGRCQNITATLQDSNNPAIAQITTDLSIILSGYSGTDGVKSKATTAECAHPRRLAALANLTACQGVNRIDHIYRRDDKSGTQDTFREHLQMDRWCNGKSEGNNGLAGSNLVNEDLDPIRRPCIGADSTKAQTRCTYYPLKTTCTAGSADITDPTYGTLKCTQGLMVALSENDPGQKDITLSIAQRVASDLNGYTVGLAGKAMVDLAGAPNVGTNINTVTYEDGNIRAGQYMLSRRLFLQRNPAGTGNTARDTEETKFFNWASNKCNLRQIVLDAGFLPPLATCSAACDDPLNITCLTADPGVGTPKQNIGAESTACNASYPCVADGTACSSGNCPVIPVLGSGSKCNVSAKCISGTCNLDATLLSGTCQ